MFLLDTNVISELRKTGTRRADRRVVAWARAVPPIVMFTSVIVIEELELGVLLLERRNALHGPALRSWLETQVLTSFASRILPVDLPVARRAAALHVPNTRPVRDSLIAATAIVHGLTIVTRNTKDFSDCGVGLIDPWQA